MTTRRAFALGLPFAAVAVRKLKAAGIDGKWQAEIEGPAGPMTMSFDLKADGGALTGTVGNEMMGMAEITDGKIDGDQVSFVQVMVRGDREMRIKFAGTLAGDELELTRSMDRPAGGPGGGPGGGQGQRRGPGPGGPGGGQGPGRGQGPGGGPGGGGRRGGGMGRPVTFTAKRVQ